MSEHEQQQAELEPSADEITRLWCLIRLQAEENRRLRQQIRRVRHAQLAAVRAELQLMHGRL